jgi:hypothetical protein
MIANVWSPLAKSSRGDCTEWPDTFNPSRANVIGRDAFNLGWTVAATEEHAPNSAIRIPQSAYPTPSLPCGEFKSCFGPIGTIRVGLMSSCV